MLGKIYLRFLNLCLLTAPGYRWVAAPAVTSVCRHQVGNREGEGRLLGTQTGNSCSVTTWCIVSHRKWRHKHGGSFKCNRELWSRQRFHAEQNAWCCGKCHAAGSGTTRNGPFGGKANCRVKFQLLLCRTVQLQSGSADGSGSLVPGLD